MIKFIAAIIIGISFNASAGELHSFKEVAEAVSKGKQLTFVWTINDVNLVKD